MAKTTITQITDDLDGSSNAETYRFGWQGTEYSIDLSSKNFKAFDKLLRPYVEAGTKITKRSSTPGKTPKQSRDLAAIRAWAKDNGHAVSERGRLPKTVLEQYDAAH